MNITSAAGIISLLEEPRPELKTFALRKLDLIVDEFWPEISEAIEKIEMLHEDKMYQNNQLAALVASKVYYHLGSFEDSLTYALGAGDLFDVNSRTEYVETIIAKCIDHYTQQRVALGDSKSTKAIDQRLEDVVNRMFQRCLEDGQYRQAVGLALETRRLDVFETSITLSNDVPAMLSYAFNVTMSLIQNRGFRNTMLRSLVGLYRNLSVPDYVNMSQCLIFLEDPLSVAEILVKLVKSQEQNQLMAYQIAFDLYESATQQFLGKVVEAIQETPSELQPPVTKIDEDNLTEDQKAQKVGVERLQSILLGDISIELHLQFLIRSNHTDLLILKHTREAVRASIGHTATVIANAFMHSGTTSDQFLRDNLEWLGRATNWAKLTATASLGVIHRGHEQEALMLMQSYLPREVGPTSGYSEGGGLYALGLIHANHGTKISSYLLTQLKEAQNEVVKHGACLGLGLAAMGTYKQEIYDELKFNLYQDDAIIGEAAGLAMGMVMLGSNNPTALEDMVSYARESQHEKILRGLAIGIAFVMFGRLEEADPLILQLSEDKDPILRRSGMYTLAMAYCGTGHNQAIRRLLHVAVSDVNDDVRRAAVTGLGFLLFRTPEHCPSVVSLLAESYNPHVRYGAAMALGIACAGTGLKEAINLLEPMIQFDSISFVRQGALIASAMILIQQTEQTSPKVNAFRQSYAQVITNKHDDQMAKFGAILAQGIIDAGGRNVTLCLQSRTGHTNMMAVVGTLLFTQYWYWFPLSHCLSLAFTPTCLITLNSDLKMPKMEFKSSAKPSEFGYPPPLEEKKNLERERVSAAVLSLATRAKRREQRSLRASEESLIIVDEKSSKEISNSAESSKDKKPNISKEKHVVKAKTVTVTEKAPSLNETDKNKNESEKKDCSSTGAVQRIPSPERQAKKDVEKISSTEEEHVTFKEKNAEKAATPAADNKLGATRKEKSPGRKDKKITDEDIKELEPQFEMLQNPARVMRQQLKVISIADTSKFTPVKDISIGGIVMVRSLKPSLEETVKPVTAFGPRASMDKEPEPPEPFEWNED